MLQLGSITSYCIDGNKIYQIPRVQIPLAQQSLQQQVQIPRVQIPLAQQPLAQQSLQQQVQIPRAQQSLQPRVQIPLQPRVRMSLGNKQNINPIINNGINKNNKNVSPTIITKKMVSESCAYDCPWP
jgi:hypothetical protein